MWARTTATAALSFAAGVGTVVWLVAGVSAKADAAKVATDDHEVRIRSLETTHSDLRGLKEQMAEMRVDVKLLLQRTAAGK